MLVFKELNSLLSLILLVWILFIFQVSIFILISCWYYKCIELIKELEC